MTPAPYTEDILVQQTTADYLEHQLGWESIYAHNVENFGPTSLLGRTSDREVVLTRYLHAALRSLNPGLPDSAYDDAVQQITATAASQTLVAANRKQYDLLRDGVPVTFHNDKGERVRQRLKVFDFETPENNCFLCVRELWVRGDLYRRRADIVGFVNGLPLLFVECKNIHRNLKAAFGQNFSDYKTTIPYLFHHNSVVMFGNGEQAKIGSITSQWEHFHEWKRLEEAELGVVDMETLLKGVCDKRDFMDLVENFILFDESSGATRKILARNHQFLGVNRAVAAVRERETRSGKLGVFWHTQGAGKSYSMVLFARKVHRKLGGNFTFLVLTDRDDLDRQIYKTFAGCGVVNHDRDPCRASDGRHLSQLLAEHKAYVFSLIQKFNANPSAAYTDRDDIIVVSDEAHRTQYGTLASNMRNALPNASYIGFTGTPLFKDDELTRRVFGEYVSTYDFQRAVEDEATVPLYYDARGDKLEVAIGDLNERIAAKLEELEIDDIDVQQRLEQALAQDYHVITANQRLDQIARDFVRHYSTAWETGKAMLVCIDKITCVRMHRLIEFYWNEYANELEAELARTQDEQTEKQIAWVRETRMAVVVSEEQGEVEKFDKPLKAHTLMQAIARANRVNEGKNNGLIVDYCGILKHLRHALATFASAEPGGEGHAMDPAKPEEDLLADLAVAIALVRDFLARGGASLDDVIGQTGFGRNAAIVSCKEVVNENDETRRRFEVMCREVFRKFRACINAPAVNDHRTDRDAIDIIYKSLQRDRDRADISDILRALHEVASEAVEVQPGTVARQSLYDISRIDFERLKQEFRHSARQRTDVQQLKDTIKKKLQRMLERNPLRTDFQQCYEAIVAAYNREKDRPTIEQTFEELLDLVQELDQEESRAAREGLDEESLAVFDLLQKSNLSAPKRERIKQVAVKLLKTLKAEKLRVSQWRDKQATRDAVHVAIYDFLWSDETGLPTGDYSEAEVKTKTDDLFRHVFRAYPTVPSPHYENAA